MKSLLVIGLAVGATLAGCASKGGARGESTELAAPAPAQERDDGAEVSRMGGACPIPMPDTTVAATESEGGIDLSFTTTTTGDVEELRQRVRRMAEMQYQRGRHGMMGGRDHDGMMGGRDHDGMMMGGGMMAHAATATVEDVEGGARMMMLPEDPAQIGALREEVHMNAQRMAGGECPMMSFGRRGEPAPAHGGPGMGAMPHRMAGPPPDENAR